MRFRMLLLYLLLLSFSIACSNKSSDQATTEPGNSQQEASSSSAPAGSESASERRSSHESKRNENSAMREKPAPAAPVVIPSGTSLTVRTQSALSSKANQTGDTFSATLANPIVVDGKEVAPEGTQAQGTVVEAKGKGKISGEARLKLALTSLTINGASYPIETTMSGFTEKGKGKRTAVATGGGAALGAIIGGIAGGGKGAAIGAAVGGGAGFAGGTFTGNKQIELPAESTLTFKLNNSVTLK